jgi:hypothetical protein
MSSRALYKVRERRKIPYSIFGRTGTEKDKHWDGGSIAY